MAALRRYREEYIMQTFTKVGLDALLTPENCVLLLIDHQPFQLANVNSHDPTIVGMSYAFAVLARAVTLLIDATAGCLPKQGCIGFPGR